MSYYIIITQKEMEMLHEKPWSARLAYLMGLKPFMDYKTCIVGLKRGISYRSIMETLAVPDGRGRHSEQQVVVTEKMVRHALKVLKESGLIEQIPADKKLIFRMPHALRDKFVSGMRGGSGADMRGAMKGSMMSADETNKYKGCDENMVGMMGARMGGPDMPMRGTHQNINIKSKKPHTEADASVSAEPEQTRKLSQAEPPRQAPLLPPVALTNNPPQREPPPKAAKQRISTVPVWTAYATAYRERYGVDPVRNSTVNGQLAHLVRRLGVEATDVARYYLDLEDGLYRREGHSVGMLLKHCEHLRTLWIRAGKVAPASGISAGEVVVAL